MHALVPPEMQLEALEPPAPHTSSTDESAHDAANAKLARRLVEVQRATAAAGILPAKRSYLLKRWLDLTLAVPTLIVTLPFFPLIMMLIRLDSRGPGLYRQIRVGQNGRLFVAYKFRTMRHTPAEQARAAHLDLVAKWMAGTPLDVAAVPSGDTPASVGVDSARELVEASRVALTSGSTAARSVSRRPQRLSVVALRFKYTSDPRITRIGQVLRKLSIDEVPQLINVVRGEMSLVGPRPPVPYEVERYSDRTLARLAVLPGITGKWQVEGRGRVTFNEMVDMDLEYVAGSSLWCDVVLLLRTLPAVLLCRGAG
jgi:lipopolysaccharide/colanic/teichoic acid biosynthesis glycosyltransferase